MAVNTLHEHRETVQAEHLKVDCGCTERSVSCHSSHGFQALGFRVPSKTFVIRQERNVLEDVGKWACGRPEAGNLATIDSDSEDAVFAEELTLDKLNDSGALHYPCPCWLL